MTTPGGQYPDGTLGTDLSGLSGLDEASWRAGLNSRVIGTGGGTVGFNGLGSALLGAIFGNVNNDYISQLPIIQEQQNYITDLRDAVERMILQGQSIFYDSSATHYISDGVVSIDFIILGGGGGGSGGRNVGVTTGAIPGAGGGGGGEVHFNVPRSLLGDSVQIMVGAGGAGGATSAPGYGGTPSKVVTASGEIAGGGGMGGMFALNASPATGGTGMIRGGNGGAAHDGGGAWAFDYPTDSTSQYDLHGGGGGGGVGWIGGTGNPVGGQGGITSGGVSPGQVGGNADGLTATGGGGGAGGAQGGKGGAGGAPSGGGGGGGANTQFGGPGGAGGNGAQGRVYVIERTA